MDDSMYNISLMDQVDAINQLAKDGSLSNYLTDSGKIDMEAISDMVIQVNKSKILKLHPYAITQLANGRWQTFLPAYGKQKKKQIRRVNKKDLEDVVVKHYLEKITVHTLEEVAYEWLNFKASEPGFKRSSYDRYENSYKRAFDGFGDTNIAKLTEYDLEDYLIKTIIDKRITRSAWANIKIILRGIFRFAKRHRYTDMAVDDVIDYIDCEKKIFTKSAYKKDSEDVFSEDEVKLIEEYIDGRDIISLVDLGIKLALRTGLRSGELAGLKYSDLDPETSSLQINRTEQHSKGEKGHTDYYFSDEGSLKCEHPSETLYIDTVAVNLIEEINARYPENDFLFYDGHFIRSQAFSKRLSDICNIIGIPPRTLHKARKTYATRLINAGVDQMLVKTQLRHKDITTTLKHYYRDNKTDAEKAAKIQAVFNAL